MCGKKHDYLAMTLNFTTPEVLKANMTSYAKKMLADFPIKFKGKSKCPWNENLFKVDESSNKLPQDQVKIFHTFVMKGMLLCKQARQDLLPGIVFLASRVKDPNEADWKKL
jgi:hypothetical protein